MKRLAAFLLCFILILSLPQQVLALESQDKLTPAPEITQLTENPDGSLSMHISHSLEEAEELRTMVYGLALQQHGSEEALLNSAEKYLSYKTRLYTEISADGHSWAAAGEITGDVASLSPDTLLSFCKDSVIFVRVILASENFRDEDTDKVYIYRESQPVTLLTDKKSFIPSGIPVKFKEKLKNDTLLFIPARTGYAFDGWSDGSAERIAKIPAGTEKITLTAYFTPRQYEINYVLTTDMNYPFGRADNSKNPVSYTVGEGARLLPLKSPIGGYTFMGWYGTPDFSGEALTGIGKAETGDKLLYARWASDKELEDIKRLEREQYIKDNKLGDPDGDGRLTASDARYVLRTAVGLQQPEYEILKRVDFFGTGKISSENARILLRVSVGLDSLYDILLENGILS